MTPEAFCPLTITADVVRGAVVLTADGVLDSSTYQTLRDVIIKAALDEPDAIVVDVACSRATNAPPSMRR